MIREAISTVGNVTTVSNYFPWKIIRGASSRPVIADLSKANLTVLARHKGPGREKERQFSCESVASSEVEGSEVGARVHFSEVVEEARVEFGAESGAGCSQRVGGGAQSSPVPKKGPRSFSIAASPSSLPPKKRILLDDDTFARSLES